MEWIASHLKRLEARTLGIVSIVFAVFLLSLSDVLVKSTDGRFGLGQIVFLRSLVAGILIAGTIIAVSYGARLRPKRPAWVWFRSLCLTAMWFCYYAALPSMSFTLAAACYYSSPAWMALMSRFVLGDTIGTQQWSAVLLTLSGVLVAVDPDGGDLSPVTLLPLLAAFFYALAAVVTRSRCREEAPMIMALSLNVTLVMTSGTFIVGLALFSPPGAQDFTYAVWLPLRVEDWVLVTLLGLFLAVIATAVAQAYRLAPSPTVGVFDNTYLLFAALWSVVLIGEVPTSRQSGGMVLIAAGAVLATCRQRAVRTPPEHKQQESGYPTAKTRPRR